MSKKSLSAITVVLLAIAAVALYTNPKFKSVIEGWMGKKTETQIVMPEQKTLVKLVQDSMHTFALSVREKEMKRFYDSISPYWKERTSVEALNKVFAPFIKAGVDLTGLQKMQPVIGKGTGLTAKKDLKVVGYYNSKPARVFFQQTYKYDPKGGWKLVEFFIQIK
jgi:hypothetical protein